MKSGLRLCQQLLARQLLNNGQTTAATSAATGLRFKAAQPDPLDDLPNVRDGKVMHPDLLNENMKKTQYAVRGELYLRAEQLRQEGKEIIFTNGKILPALCGNGMWLPCCSAVVPYMRRPAQL